MEFAAGFARLTGSMSFLEQKAGWDAVSRRRYRLAAYSTAANIVSKALNVLVLYVSVPLTISYLGNVRFGIWMTLVSTISMLGFLDFGVGSSLLNLVAHAAAADPPDRLKNVITHGLFILLLLGAALMLLLLALAHFIPILRMFHVSSPHSRLRTAAYVLAVLIGLSLPMTGLLRVFWGLQRAYLYYILISVGRLASLAFLFILSHLHAHIYELLLATYGMQLLFTLPLLLVLIWENLVGISLDSGFLHDARQLLRQGILFFILSIGGAVAWDSDNIIIAKIMGAAAVAVYAVAVRLFQIVELSLQTVNNPLWSAYADAYAQGSRHFLRHTLTRSLWVTFAAAFLGLGLLVSFYHPLIRLWIRQAVVLPQALVLAMAVWFLLRCVGNAFAMYLNGIRRVRIQVVVVTAFCALALPLKFYLTSVAGLSGIVWASVASYLICVFIPYVTFYRKDWQSALLD